MFVVGVIVGSLRRDSINRKVARALIELAPPSLKPHFIDIDRLTLFNQDLELDPPQSWKDFQNDVRAADAILIVSPEYNRGVPGVLKNAFDIGSRPFGKSVWTGKPAAVVTASPSATGGFGAHHHIRQTLVSLNMPTLPQPEVYLGHADKLFDDMGALKDDSTRNFLSGFMKAFARWAATNAAAESARAPA